MVETEAAFARGEIYAHVNEVYCATDGHQSLGNHIYCFYALVSVGIRCVLGAAAVLSVASEDGRQSTAGSVSGTPVVEDLAITF